LSLTNGEAGNLFIPGHFSHAAYCKGDNQIIEAVGVGVRETDFFDFFLGKDHIMLLRPIFASDEEKKLATEYCISKIGLPYNVSFKFSLDDKKFYCCEIIYKAYKYANPESPFKLRRTLGVDTVVPDDFLNASSKWKVIWDSSKI